MPRRGYPFVETDKKVILPRQGLPFANYVAPDGIKNDFIESLQTGDPPAGGQKKLD